MAMSCVMGNRLCLNVRSMLHADELSAPTKPPAVQRSHISVSHYGGHSQPQIASVVVFAGSGSAGTVLTEVEMDELRDMRAARVHYV